MGDAEALAQAIIRLFENREQARAMGKAGRERVETHFSIQATTRHVEAVYESMLLERKKK
jgi:glycosyltransferase involved in cell wall biosynthesis